MNGRVDMNCRPHSTCLNRFSHKLLRFIVLSNLYDNITRVTSFKHVPEIFGKNENLFAFLEVNLVVVQLIMPLIFSCSIISDLNGDLFVVYLAWMRAFIAYKISPLCDPSTIYYEIGQAAIFNYDSI